MTPLSLQDLMRQAETLPPDEQLYLIAYLAERARQSFGEAPKRRHWSEIRGAATYPLVGEDAQDWVSRTRRESDEERGSTGEVVT
ncbi:MAG: hypothetical protein M3014_02615 [Chloroflexota bacterium]|nr:hypothetical protein [Chloroflexota bacterium]